jgi:hypothetical protein
VSGTRERSRPDQSNRLAFNDDMYLRVGRVLGTPMVNQLVWRFDRPLDELDLEGLRDRLAAGPISRLVERSWLPAARDRWIPAPATDRQLRIGAAMPDEAFREWIDGVAATPVDPEIGPPWVLDAAPLGDRGSAVSLLVSHVVCDGTILLPTIDAAARGVVLPCLPAGSQIDPGPAADLADAVGQLRQAAVGIRAAWRFRRRAPGTRPDRSRSTSERVVAEPRPARMPIDRPRPAPTAFLEVPLAAWDAAAQQRSGTRNTLLVAVTASLWGATGAADDGSTVHVAVPVATRAEGDARANTTVGVRIPVALTAERYTDLGAVRAASRLAFERRAVGSAGNPLEPLKPLMQMLPDRVLARMASGTVDPCCTASNVDLIGEGIRGLGGPPARRVAMRTVPQRLTPSAARRLGAGLTCWLWVHGDVVAVGVQSLDLERFVDDAALRELVEAEVARWSLPSTLW